MTASLPKHLYRCLPQRVEVLRPTVNEEGIANPVDELLYAYENSDNAVEHAICWLLGQKYKVLKFHRVDKKITIELMKGSAQLTHSSLCRLSVYLYTIVPQLSDDWSPLFNPRTERVDEWRTAKTIRTLRSTRLVSMFDWLVGKTVIINYV